MARWKLGEQWDTDGGSLPPWDGTGIPLPVDENGWPDGGGGADTLRITEPVDGDAVDPLVTIRGEGAEDGDTVDLYMDSSPGAPVASVPAAADGSFEFTGSTPLEVSPEGITVGVGAKRSAKITVTVTGVTPTAEDLNGWTKAELTQFAENHEPPIEVPSGSTKAQIIALILAALQDDDTTPNGD
jgi:hypothetical protein